MADFRWKQIEERESEELGLVLGIRRNQPNWTSISMLFCFVYNFDVLNFVGYGMSNMVSEAGDVYSYDVFVLEMFTNINKTNRWWSTFGPFQVFLILWREHCQVKWWKLWIHSFYFNSFYSGNFYHVIKYERFVNILMCYFDFLKLCCVIFFFW